MKDYTEAWVYCGKHYGLKHRIIAENGNYYKVQFDSETPFLAPKCDCEIVPPDRREE